MLRFTHCLTLGLPVWLLNKCLLTGWAREAARTQGSREGSQSPGEHARPTDGATGVCEEVGSLKWMEFETQTAVQGQSLPWQVLPLIAKEKGEGTAAKRNNEGHEIERGLD